MKDGIIIVIEKAGIGLAGIIGVMAIVGIIGAVLVGGTVFEGLVSSPKVIAIILSIAGVSGLTATVSATCTEKSGVLEKNHPLYYGVMFVLNYIMLLILWFMILSVEDSANGFNMILSRIILIPTGFTIMLVIGLGVSFISWIFKLILEKCLAYKISRIIAVGLILIGLLALILFFINGGIEKILKVLENIDF